MFFVLVLFILGIVCGSFLNVVASRLPSGKSLGGRSLCLWCKTKIFWYDNIPILSFLVLGGRCRHCRKQIPIRYPLTEFFTGILFVSLGLAYRFCNQGVLLSEACRWSGFLDRAFLPFSFVLAGILVAIFLIDLEHKLVPDILVFPLLFLTLVLSLFLNFSSASASLFAGFISSTFLLLIFFLTRGRGMGLGDVKLALPLGILMGITKFYYWLFTSFLLGATVGVILILLKKAKPKDRIAFGPYLIISFFFSWLIS